MLPLGKCYVCEMGTSSPYTRVPCHVCKSILLNAILSSNAVLSQLVEAVADPGRGATGPPPPPPPRKFDQLCFFPSFVSECFKVRLRWHERASKILELSGPLSGPWTLAVREFALRVRDVRCAHIIYHTPSQMKILDPPLIEGPQDQK